MPAPTPSSGAGAAAAGAPSSSVQGQGGSIANLVGGGGGTQGAPEVVKVGGKTVPRYDEHRGVTAYSRHFAPHEAYGHVDARKARPAGKTTAPAWCFEPQK